MGLEELIDLLTYKEINLKSQFPEGCGRETFITWLLLELEALNLVSGPPLLPKPRTDKS